MLELGPSAEEAHVAVGKRAGQVSEIVIARGEFAGHVLAGAKQAGRKSGQAVATRDSDELAQKLVDFAQPGDTILIKGSRANHLEEIVQELKERIEKRMKDEL
jgi:UDP-N-acetylmuramoyl-tripeptide--D-alanyl-D-alanine ligase